METAPQSRRKFITTLAALLAAGGLLTRYLIPRTAGKRQALVTASAADIPANGALVFQNERVALMRDEKGVYALSLICTHLGCTVTVTEDVISCPCHGSRFDRRGMPVKGPADKPLVSLELIEHNGKLEVYGS
jgi:nitrite reductase/ring-hydroxylating ferredoxin subunit